MWQTAYHDQYNSFVRDRIPMAFNEMNPDDARPLGVAGSDVVTSWVDRNVVPYYKRHLGQHQTRGQRGRLQGNDLVPGPPLRLRVSLGLVWPKGCPLFIEARKRSQEQFSAGHCDLCGPGANHQVCQP